ncbi:hypothetical protein ACT7DA_15540 [Bacillus pacificus]
MKKSQLDSEVAFWETGLQGQELERELDCCEKKATKVMSFNKSFSIKKLVEKARLYITSLGLCETL